MEGAEVLLGLGANLGDPIAQLRRAGERLEEVVAVDTLSSVYRTEPVGMREQPDFFNLVCRGRARTPPLETLRALLRLEVELGRERSVRDAPRTIDLDLLAHGEAVVEEEELVLPHPRLHRRAFVLVPLREVAPRWVHPRLGLTAEEMLRRAGASGRVDLWGPLFPAR